MQQAAFGTEYCRFRKSLLQLPKAVRPMMLSAKQAEQVQLAIKTVRPLLLTAEPLQLVATHTCLLLTMLLCSAARSNRHAAADDAVVGEELDQGAMQMTADQQAQRPKQDWKSGSNSAASQGSDGEAEDGCSEQHQDRVAEPVGAEVSQTSSSFSSGTCSLDYLLCSCMQCCTIGETATLCFLVVE